MFGKKKDSDTVTTPTNESGQDTAARNYLKPDAAAAGVSRPAPNPEIARRPPDLSAFAPRRPDAAAASQSPTPTPPPAGQSTDSKKLIVGRGINLNGEIRTCDSLVVEGTVDANGQFTSRRMMVKHDNEYRAPEAGEKPSDAAMFGTLDEG